MPLERLKPRFLEKIWGSESLEPWFPATEIAAAGGPAGSTIGEVWFEGPELPVLVKFLFTSAALSVQVHPGDDYAARHHSSRGKTEMWHILAAEPGARIAAGFRETVSAERLRESALSGEIESLLAWHDCAPGDTFFIPAGTVHAIGAGLALCEIQQHSDVTYRLYDYGRPRELHLDHSIAVSRREPHRARVERAALKPDNHTLVSCPYFDVSRHEVNGVAGFAPPPGCFALLIATAGQGEAAGKAVRAGEVWYAAPGTNHFSVSGSLTLLWVAGQSKV